MSAPPAGEPAVSKGLLITLGVVVVVAAAVGLWMFVLQPAGDDADRITMDDPAGDDGADADDGDDPDLDGDDRDDDVPDIATGDDVEVVTARDPFQQLAGGDEAATAESAATTGDDDSTASDDAGSDDAGGDDDRAAVGSTTLTLTAIYTGDDAVTRAAVEVDGTGYDVAEGDTFAETFQLLDLTDTCATMRHGDSRFTLCEGDRVRK